MTINAVGGAVAGPDSASRRASERSGVGGCVGARCGCRSAGLSSARDSLEAPGSAVKLSRNPARPILRVCSSAGCRPYRPPPPSIYPQRPASCARRASPFAVRSPQSAPLAAAGVAVAVAVAAVLPLGLSASVAVSATPVPRAAFGTGARPPCVHHPPACHGSPAESLSAAVRISHPSPDDPSRFRIARPADLLHPARRHNREPAPNPLSLRPHSPISRRV